MHVWLLDLAQSTNVYGSTQGQDKASWAGPRKWQLLQLARKCWKNALQSWHTVHWQEIWVLPLFYDQYPVGYAFASKGKRKGRGFKELSLCGACTSLTGLQCDYLSAAGASPWEEKLCNRSKAGLCDLDDSPVCPSTDLSSSPQVTAKQRWQRWKALRAAMSQPRINPPPWQLAYQIIKATARSWWCQCFVSEHN